MALRRCLYGETRMVSESRPRLRATERLTILDEDVQALLHQERCVEHDEAEAER